MYCEQTCTNQHYIPCDISKLEHTSKAGFNRSRQQSVTLSTSVGQKKPLSWKSGIDNSLHLTQQYIRLQRSNDTDTDQNQYVLHALHSPVQLAQLPGLCWADTQPCPTKMLLSQDGAAYCSQPGVEPCIYTQSKHIGSEASDKPSSSTLPILPKSALDTTEMQI